MPQPLEPNSSEWLQRPGAKYPGCSAGVLPASDGLQRVQGSRAGQGWGARGGGGAPGTEPPTLPARPVSNAGDSLPRVGSLLGNLWGCPTGFLLSSGQWRWWRRGRGTLRTGAWLWLGCVGRQEVRTLCKSQDDRVCACVYYHQGPWVSLDMGGWESGGTWGLRRCMRAATCAPRCCSAHLCHIWCCPQRVR